ncbi:hypothetical protein GOP47_0011466 [Adiantum capillus-veneris]|uniref:Uncharacterized protein n=1 Tax=Adiantum capillus-veneris TaxID=13818 RepID=A0A9D4USV1_ADICA|nr:hypothetical protein GOP47_0011466 [Adiantum capillus-veneris]
MHLFLYSSSNHTVSSLLKGVALSYNSSNISTVVYIDPYPVLATELSGSNSCGHGDLVSANFLAEVFESW